MEVISELKDEIEHTNDNLCEQALEHIHTGEIILTYGASTARSEEHTSELQSLMRISYAVFCLKKKTNSKTHNYHKKPINTNIIQSTTNKHHTSTQLISYHK